MKKFSTSVTLMFREQGILDRFSAAAKAGFKGVEIQYLAEGDPREMAKAASDAGVEVVLINVGMGDFLKGGFGLSGVPGREQLFRAEVEEALNAAQLMDSGIVHLGPSRIPEGVQREACMDCYRANIEVAISLAKDSGRQLVIEPMNRVEGPNMLVNDIDVAGDLIRGGFDGRVGLIFDIYHAAMNGTDLRSAFARHQNLIRHIQFADAPGRHEPGSGTIDFSGLLGEIEDSGYRGWLGAEYLPSKATPETLNWLTRFQAEK